MLVALIWSFGIAHGAKASRLAGLTPGGHQLAASVVAMGRHDVELGVLTGRPPYQGCAGCHRA